MSTEADVPSTEGTNKPGGNVLESDFRELGFVMDRLYLTRDEVERVRKLFQKYQAADTDYATTNAPQPLSSEQQSQFLEKFVRRLIGEIGLPNATFECTVGAQGKHKEWMQIVTGYPDKGFCDNFSFRDSKGGVYLVEVAFVPRTGFKANIRSIPNTREGSGSTPLVTQGSPAASAPGSGA